VLWLLNALNITSNTAAATANADLNILFEENLIFGRPYTNAAACSASGGNLAGGISYKNNTFFSQAVGATVASRVSTTTPIRFIGNIMIGSGAILGAGTSGQIIDDGYNRLFNFSGTAAYSNVTQAGSSFIGVAPNLVLPHLVKWGLEMPRADMFGWTDAAHADQKFSASGLTTADFMGRTARPWGAGASVGYRQVANVAQDTSSAISTGGANSLKLTGAGEVSLYVPVDATSTTISVVTKSTSYGGTDYPQLIVRATGAIGLAADVTVTASSASEQTITTASFTPTVQGVVEVRLVSRSTSTTSATYFDALARS
jgi:hypothetical protein